MWQIVQQLRMEPTEIQSLESVCQHVQDFSILTYQQAIVLKFVLGIQIITDNCKINHVFQNVIRFMKLMQKIKPELV